jgi:uncharacterized BrkB/YihY/UPF0761 family membrane protein
MADIDDEKQPPMQTLIRNGAWAILFLLVGAGSWSITAALGAFNSNVFLAPIRLMMQLWPFAVLMLFVVVSLCYLGVRRRKKMWYLLPIGLVLAGAVWLTASLMVVNLIRDAKKEAQISAVKTNAGVEAKTDTGTVTKADTGAEAEIDTAAETSPPAQ